MTHLYSKLKDYRTNNRGRSKIFIDFIELLLAAISFPIAILLARLTVHPEMVFNEYHLSVFYLFIIISWFVLSRVTALAKVPRTQRYLTMLFQLSRVTFIIFLALLAFKVIFRLTSIPVIVIVSYVTIMFLIVGTFRMIAFSILKSFRMRGHSLHHVLLVADSFSDNVIDRLLEQKEWGFKIHGLMSNSRLIKAKYGDSIKVYSDTDNLKAILDNEVIDEVIYCRKTLNKDIVKGVANLCDETGVIFRLQSSISPLDPVDFQLKTVANQDQLSLIDAPSNSLSLILKSVGDIYFSLLASILLFPLFLFVAMVIKFDSPGPVFFKQERIGLRGRKFKLYKFRTMVTNAEELLARLQEKNEADGPVFKMKHDPRITRIGRLLRKTGLDELPQLINVLKGEMSLIGPRPPLEHEVKKYKRWQLKRLSVKPGITCTWQVVPNRHDVSFEEWMKLDMGYINNWNIFKDLGLFFKTLRALLTAGGH